MKQGFDYKEYEKWVKKVGLAKQDFDGWLQSFLLTQAQRVVALAKQRQSTYAYVNYKGLLKIGVVDTGAMLNEWYIGNITGEGNTLKVEIGNNAEYASYIEYGHRSFKPVYILTISIDTIQKQLPARFNKEWLKFIKSKGVV